MNKSSLFVALVFYGLLCGLLRCGVFGKIHYQKIHRQREGVVGTAIRNFVLSKSNFISQRV